MADAASLLFGSPDEPEPEQDYNCNRCGRDYRGPSRIGWDHQCPHCGSPPPFAVMLGLQPARAISGTSMEPRIGRPVVTAGAGIQVMGRAIYDTHLPTVQELERLVLLVATILCIRQSLGSPDLPAAIVIAWALLRRAN
jgi:hypothetical protein